MTDPMPNTNYAQGPGGLFSSPALEGGKRRKSKSAQRRAEKAQRTFGGVRRADLPDSAFLDRARRAFPVMTAQDVRDAVSSWGRYQGPMTFDQFKRRLTRRARAIGASAALPASWGERRREKAAGTGGAAPCGCSEGDDSATGAARLKAAPIASGGITTKPFASRAQQRWAFATNQDFAERWADETGDTAAFRRLPEKVVRKSKSAARRLGLLDPAEMERAEKAGERIAGQLCRSKDGKFVNCNSKQATQESKDKLRKQARDQKKQEAAAERQAKRRENEKAVGEGAGLGASLSDALLEFASPDENITLAPQNAEALLAKGLIERNPDGSYRISGAGRSYIAAARAGDVSKARDAIGRGEDRAARRAATEQRRAAAEAKRLAKEQGKDPKEAKPKKGGGGGKGKDEKPAKLGTGNLRSAGPSGSSRPASGGGSSSSRNAPEKKPAPSADERRAQAAQERESRARETAQRVGLADSAYDALRAAAEGQGGNAALDALGLTQGGEATDQGRRALTALERGDVRTYQAALQDARNRLARESAAEERKREKVKRSHGYWKTYRKARADGLLPIEARKKAREQVLQTKMNRASRQRNALASALLGI